MAIETAEENVAPNQNLPAEKPGPFVRRWRIDPDTSSSKVKLPEEKPGPFVKRWKITENPTTPKNDTVKVQIGPFKKEWTLEEGVAKLIDLEPWVYRGTKVIFEPGAAEAIAKDIEEGYTDGIFLNHQSQYDGPAGAKAVKEVLKIINRNNHWKPKRYIAPIAASIGSGDQDSALKKFYEAMTKKMEDDGLFMTAFTREKDKTKYKLDRSREAIHKSNETMENFYDNNFLPAIWSETILDGGRMNWERTGLHGVQPFERLAMSHIARQFRLRGEKLSFIPIAISGSYKVLNPENHRPPGSTMVKAKIADMTNGIIDLTDIATVRIGKPIRWDDMIAERKAAGLSISDEAINDYFGAEIAEMLPYHERGVHRIHKDGTRTKSSVLRLDQREALVDYWNQRLEDKKAA